MRIIPKDVKIENTGVIEVDVRVRQNPNDSFGFSVMRGNKTFVAFKNETDMKLTLAASGNIKDNTLGLNFKKGDREKNISARIPIQNTALFYRAYPGLYKAEELFLETNDPNLNLTPKCKGKDLQNGKFSFNIPTQWLGANKTVTISQLRVRYGPGNQFVEINENLKIDKESE